MTTSKRASLNILQNKYFFLIFTFFILGTNPLLADTSISDGKLYICSESTIISVKGSKEVKLNKSIKRYRKIVTKQKSKIRASAKGSKKRRKAVLARKAAKQAIKDLRKCKKGELGDFNELDGVWNIVLENGLTPAENEYTSLMLTISNGTFTSDLKSIAINCHWEGTITQKTAEPLAIDVLTTIGTGGSACEQAIDRSRPASVTLSDDKNTLTLDYSPDGTLQVYERVS